MIDKLIPQLLQQTCDREIDDLGVDRTRFDLVDIEQRVQHSRHRAERLVQTRNKFPGLFRLDILCQQSLHQSQGLQWLAQIVACCGEEPRFGGIRLIGLPLGDPELVRHMSPLGDIGKCDDDSLYPAALCAIGQDATDEAGAVLRFAISRSSRLQGLQNRCGIGHQIAIHGERIQIRKRTSDIAGNDREQRFRCRREKSDVQIFVQKQRRDIGAVQNVL